MRFLKLGIFHQTTPPGPIRGSLEPFLILAKFHGVRRPGHLVATSLRCPEHREAINCWCPGHWVAILKYQLLSKTSNGTAQHLEKVPGVQDTR